MFSGIIEHVGYVVAISVREHAMDLQIDTGFRDLSEGESIATNGVCLTVVSSSEEGHATFHVSGETLARTALGKLEVGQRVNLERAVSLNTRLSGHIVQGHVDTVGRLVSVQEVGDSHNIRVFIPQDLRRYIIGKGSITLNGISLTVNTIHEEKNYAGQKGFVIGLMIIPHTWTHTDLSTLNIDDYINVEVDMMAKYVENLLLHTDGEDLAPSGGVA